MSILSKSILMGAALALTAPVTPVLAEIPRAPSTPNTPKNWMAPDYKIRAQQIVDELAAAHPEVVSITIHAIPDGLTEYSMIAGTFPDRIGNESSPGDAITAVKGVTQVESKWGTENYGKKVSIVVPVMDQQGNYLKAAMVIAFKQWPTSGLIDIDFMQPGVRIRNSIAHQVPTLESLFDRAE